MVGREVRLDVRDQVIVGLAGDIGAARAVDDLHGSLLVRSTS
jgi:hypothetical protein